MSTFRAFVVPGLMSLVVGLMFVQAGCRSAACPLGRCQTFETQAAFPCCAAADATTSTQGLGAAPGSSAAPVYGYGAAPSSYMEQGPGPTAANRDLVALMTDSGRFKTFLHLLNMAGLTDQLEGPGPFTVFAPTDEAFNRLPYTLMNDLTRPDNRSELVAMLNYHIVPGRFWTAGLSGIRALHTVEGQDIRVAVEGGMVLVDNMRAAQVDIPASNGVLYVIDSVLMPPVAGVSIGGEPGYDVGNAPAGQPTEGAGWDGQVIPIIDER